METSLLCWLCVRFWGGERLHGGEVDPRGAWRDLNNVQRLEAQSWVSKQRGSVGHTDGEMGRRREKLDRIDDANATPEGGCHSELARVNEAAS